jgi:amino acid adenylation domain-containing protein
VTENEICLPDLFERQVERTPDAEAAVAGSGSRISYRELNERANRLAHHLDSLGAGPETMVGIFLEPSLDAVVSLWAVLKAGAAYVPLDTRFPASRIESSIAAASVDVVVTTTALRDSLPPGPGVVLALDAADQLAASPVTNPVRRLRSANAALVIFTSGSTGKPKGVVLVHEGLVNAYRFWEDEFELRRGVDSHCQVTSFAFAVFHADVIRAHCSGGKLVLCTPDVVTSPERLYRLMRDERVRFVEFVPAILRNLLAWVEESSQSLSFLRIAVVSSDRWCVREHHWLRRLCGPGTRCMQSFGATETSIDTARFEGGLDSLAEHELTPIGVPFPNVAVHLVDGDLRPVPAGETGEMLTGGAGVARGYIGDPALTASRFLPDPFGSKPGARAYRSGDLARLLPDGAIQFLGRDDDQGKVRGFRVELGEVEAALELHEGIRQAVAALRDLESERPSLVGYFLPADPAHQPSTSELRGFVAQRLPDYMVPTAFVVLDAVPHTPTGKVDRSALPRPGEPQDLGEYVAPRTPVEGVVASIWADVLDAPQIGVHDNFFELGGQSMTAARVLSRLERAFSARLSLRDAFECPTVAELAARIEDPERDEDASGRPELEPAERDRMLRASFAQSRLWFLDQLQPGNTAYNITSLVTFRGPCAPPAVERAVNEIVARHEALRTTFLDSETGLLQTVSQSLVVPLPMFDFSGWADPTEGLRQVVSTETRTPFDLERGPLLRVSLLRLGPELHVLVVALHHIAADGWSLSVFEREVRALHGAFTAGRDSPLEPLPVQYPDYALWQRQWLQGPVLEGQLEHWTARLSGAPALTELPSDRPRPTVQTHQGATWFSRLPAELSEELDRLARREGATRFMILLAGFFALVHRLSGVNDLVVGTPTANRRHPDAELLIGCFANTLALRADLSANPTFRELLAHAREEVLAAYRNQDVPFEQVVDAVQPERSLGHHALFQLMFALQEPAESDVVEPFELPAEPVLSGTQFDLAVSVQHTSGGIVVTWEYSTDLFDQETIARFARHFETLLAAAAARPNTDVDSLDVLTPAERRRLLVDWNDSALESRGLVHELFEQQVRLTPDADAVVAGRNAETYAALNGRANRLAHLLTERGVAAEVAVGVCLERSLDMVVALLAVLKAGGFYVPLEPSFPAERIAFTLADAGARVLITKRALEERLPADTPPRVFVGEGGDDLSAFPDHDPGAAVDERNLVALIYTSGSTGRPKAAAIEHRSVVSLAAWSSAVLLPEDLSGVLAVSSICFDLSLLELFATLARGGRVLLAEDAMHVPSLPAASEARFLATFPSIASELLHGGGVPCGLRTINIGGEPFPSALVDRIYAETGIQRVHNMYGPTEDTVYSTYELLTRGSSAAPRIGRPVGNTRVYVLDRLLRPVPIGVAGEVYLAGAGVARGYINRPALTAVSFLPDPFAGRSGERMYRTGDLARHCADGSLEFVGRTDDQVKVRGYRIELGEIDSVLSRHPAVLEVAAAVHVDGNGEKQLIAYVALEEGAEPTADALAETCRESLPRYMVPSGFVPVAKFPRKANGKVDRKRLPTPDAARLEVDGFVLPRSHTEEALVGIWTELLPGARVGVNDDFFALGGHSLLATRVLVRVREALGAQLTLRDFFEAPTLSGLAERVEAVGRAEGTGIERVRRDRPLPLSFAQQRLWWLEQLHPGTDLYNVTLQARLEGAADPAVVAAALEEIVRRHEVLRTTFGAREGTPMQRVGPVRRPDLPVLDARTMPGAWELAARQAEAPFDLEHGPLLRACLLRVSDELSLLRVTMHHTVTDGWSQGIFLEELLALLASFGAGEPPSIPLPPIQYADYAAWQREHMTGPLLERGLSYWAELLGSDPPRFELPADRPRPAVPDGRGAVQTFAVPREVSARVRALAAEEGATLFMTLLAGFGAFAHRVTGEDLLVLGTVTANRNRPETERLIGLFVNTLALPVDVSGNPTFRSLLGRVRETMLGASAHQDLPFEKLVEELMPARSLDRNPLFDVMFVLQNAVGGDLAEPPSPTNGDVLPGVAKFDLTVTVAEGDELAVSWEYRRALFDDATIARFSDCLLRVLDAAAANPDVRVGDLSLLSQGDRDRLVREWSTTAVEEEALSSLQAAFERSAAEAPEAVAIAWPGGEIAYADLRAQAGRLSRFLLERGLRPETRVAVCLDRSPRLVAAFLGVLGAGGCYVPLDPALPAARLGFVVEDARAEWVLTETGLAERFAGQEHRLILLDTLDAELERLPPEPPACALGPRSLAYAIYTSGTTGTPKGAMIEHGGLANLELALRSAFGFTEGDRILQLASPSFDASIFEIVCALGGGATLCMAPADELIPGHALERTIEELAVNAVVVTPSALSALRPESVPSLRVVIAAAEACSYEVARTWAVGRKLFNAYGPTETSVWATVAVLDGHGRPPIGRPVANVRTYVLDERLEPVPVGVVGELHIGGPGVGRGYLGRPELTAAAYVPDPFSTEPGARLYRTGDLCRFLPDGSIDYVGRRDEQVKLRGFRIELGEITSVLEQHPSVRAAAARMVEEDSPRKRLVGYAVPQEGVVFEQDVLRRWLEDRLPAYMVPAVIIELEQLPRSPTGKLDRARLPIPAAAPRPAAADEASVDNPVEEVVAAIWAQCLGLESADRDTNFFELGGHSLLAAELLARIEAACEVHLPLPVLFVAPTVRGLATEVLAAMSSPEADRPPPLRPALHASTIPLSRGQARLWAASRLRSGGGSYNLSGVVDLPERCAPEVLRLALNEVVARHEALRTRFVEADGQPRQMVEPAVRVELPVVDLSGLPVDEAEEEVRERLAELAATRFELDAAPLLGAWVFRLPGEDLLAIVAHHLIADGWSLGVLFRELHTVYRAFLRRLPSPLPPLAVQFADWVLWQREPHPFRAAQLAYWRGQLAGLPEALELDCSHPRPAVPRNRGRSLSFTIDAETTSELRSLHRREGCTLFMALLAAYGTLLHRRTGATDLAIGTDMANRVPAGAETLVGMLINQVVLRLNLEGAPDFLELLRRARRLTGEAYAHQSVPFEELVDELLPRRDQARPPLVQFKLVLENTDLGLQTSSADAEEVDHPAWEARDDTPAQLDLTLYVYDLGDRLRGLLVYDVDLFDDADAELLARELQDVLRELVDDPSAQVMRARERVR